MTSGTGRRTFTYCDWNLLRGTEAKANAVGISLNIHNTLRTKRPRSDTVRWTGVCECAKAFVSGDEQSA